MDGFLPFRPQGTGMLLAVTPNAPAAATQLTNPNAGDVCYLVFNPSGTAADAWLGYGMTSAAAIANAIVPTLAGPGTPALACPAGSLQTFTLSPGLYFAARTQLGSCSLSITPGYGN